MANRLTKLISDQEAAYLSLLITGSDPVASKNALQQLCKRYRGGCRVRDERVLRRILLGSLEHPDPKVVRWSLNALAFIARDDDSKAIIRTISENREDPDILGAGVAALASIKGVEQLREDLDKIDLPLHGAALFAAAQQLQELEPELRHERVSIDTDRFGSLRLATVLVGIDKAPEHLFDLNHKNSAMLGKLNFHPDPLTAQYSIWALTERSDYGVSDLDIPLADVSSQRENIRAYIYQLVAEDEVVARSELDLLRQGIGDETEVRDHLARGLRNTYFPELADIALAWYLNEEDDKTRRRLLDHIACHSEVDDKYLDFASSLVKGDGIGSLERAQIEASAGKKLDYQIRQFRYQRDTLEIMGGVFVTNYNIGNINAGAVAFGGNATVAGDANVTVEQATKEARKLAGQILEAASKSREPLPKDVESSLLEAKDTPRKSNMHLVLQWLKSSAKIGGAVLAAIGGVPGAVEGIELLLPHLPE